MFALPVVMAADIGLGLWFFSVFYGLDWVATVPPTVALCRQHFGLERSGRVFASHMIGAGAGATVAGLIRSPTGGYQDAWLLAAALCLGAAAVVLTISKPRPVARKAAPRSHA